MYVNSPVCSNAVAVFGGWVAFVGIPAEVRMLLVVFEHEVISGGFCQYRGCSYVEVFPISTYDTVMGMFL